MEYDEDQLYEFESVKDPYHILIFCDGSSSTDNKSLGLKEDYYSIATGAYALVAIQYNEKKDSFDTISTKSKAEFQWSASRSELEGVLESLRTVSRLSKQNPKYRFTIYTDSRYIVDGYRKYLYMWAARNWVKMDGTEIKYKELWKEFWRYVRFELEYIKINIIWIKAHQNNKRLHAYYNNLVDNLANKTRIEYRKTQDSEYRKLLNDKNPLLKTPKLVYSNKIDGLKELKVPSSIQVKNENYTK